MIDSQENNCRSYQRFSGSASVSLSFNATQSSVLGLSAIPMRRLCNKHATKRKMEHIPNITVMGNASTLYNTMQTKIFSGMRKKFMMVLLASSGMYWDLIFIMDGQNSPTQASKAQNPRSWIQPAKEMLPPFTLEGATKKLVTMGSRREEAEMAKTICI